MNSRERIRAIISGKTADRCGFWLGNPHNDTWPILHDYFKTETEEELRVLLNDDVRWICPQYIEGTYNDPSGKKMFDLGIMKERHGTPGPFANCESVEEVDSFYWPNVKYLNFDNTLKILKNSGDIYRASGFWTCFYHDLMDLFGMESYLIKMYTHPEVVEAVTNKICEFYYEANEMFFKKAGNMVDGFFFGNDFGTQRDLICSPEMFDQFIMPWFKKFTDQAHSYGYQVILHSCGAIYKVIDRLIDAGVDCLHPIQAKAYMMDAENLSSKFGGKITFMGGIDTQELLVNGSPEEVYNDVKRVKNILCPRLIVSPSHEALLPNVPPNNIKAMAEAAIL
jgi:uroporphyrinogen decarboxylase